VSSCPRSYGSALDALLVDVLNRADMGCCPVEPASVSNRRLFADVFGVERDAETGADVGSSIVASGASSTVRNRPNDSSATS
jgi:hypothetical protein